MELCAQDSRDAPWREGFNESWKQPPCKLEEEVCKWAYVIDQNVIHLDSSCSVKIKVILSVDWVFVAPQNVYVEAVTICMFVFVDGPCKEVIKVK